MERKRLTAAGIIAFSLAVFSLGAQQITRVAVVDLSRIMAAFPNQTQAIKNFETRKAEVQAVVDVKALEIRTLQARRNEIQNQNGMFDEMATLDAKIVRLTAELKEYLSARQNELDLLARSISSNTSFIQKLNGMIAQVAEAEGFSLVLNLKPQDPSAAVVLWNSPSVDLTDKIIQAMAASR
ncbi:MAG: outer membrane protein [Spirochaetes bacterium]|nr:MAG: outer membrane protein [Spirochaetota bacterium]